MNIAPETMVQIKDIAEGIVRGGLNYDFKMTTGGYFNLMCEDEMGEGMRYRYDLPLFDEHGIDVLRKELRKAKIGMLENE